MILGVRDFYFLLKDSGLIGLRVWGFGLGVWVQGLALSLRRASFLRLQDSYLPSFSSLQVLYGSGYRA